jgi:hypothetical protein
MTGVLPAELEALPLLPELATFVWSTFIELSAFRGSNGFGMNPITPTDILAWCNLTGTKLQAWEIRAIGLLDNKYMMVNQNDN